VGIRVKFLCGHVSFSLGCLPGNGIARSYDSSLFEEPLDSFPNWLHHFIFPSAVDEGSNSSTFTHKALVNVFYRTILVDTQVSQCVSDFPFPEGQ
jgi:hypothetical protein